MFSFQTERESQCPTALSQGGPPGTVANNWENGYGKVAFANDLVNHIA